VQISHACQAVIANEDFVLASERFVIVLDGATDSGLPNGCVHGVAWLARRLGGQLAAVLIGRPELALREVLRQGIVNTRALHPECDLANRRPGRSAGRTTHRPRSSGRWRGPPGSPRRPGRSTRFRETAKFGVVGEPGIVVNPAHLHCDPPGRRGADGPGQRDRHGDRGGVQLPRAALLHLSGPGRRGPQGARAVSCSSA
jgi:hypothetical protein